MTGSTTAIEERLARMEREADAGFCVRGLKLHAVRMRCARVALDHSGSAQPWCLAPVLHLQEIRVP